MKRLSEQQVRLRLSLQLLCCVVTSIAAAAFTLTAWQFASNGTPVVVPVLLAGAIGIQSIGLWMLRGRYRRRLVARLDSNL